MKYQKMNQEKKAALRKVALLIRFRTDQPTIKSYKYATYRVIAATLNLT
jgi:hypothetical protein